jgi:hypothetical protein
VIEKGKKMQAFSLGKYSKKSTIKSITSMACIRSSLASILTFSLFGMLIAHAEPFIPEMNEPKNFAEIQYGIDEARQNRETVECGGWIKESQGSGAGGTVDGQIYLPEISSDVPGDENLAETERGDALKNGVGVPGDFEYPDSAFGYLSACDLHESFMYDPDLAQLGLSITYDDIADPDNDPNVRTEAGDGKIQINPYGWCEGDKRTPRWCQKLFETWNDMAVNIPEIYPSVNPDCADPPVKKYCFSVEFTHTCRGQECRTVPADNQCRDVLGPYFYQRISQCHRDLMPDGVTLTEPIIDFQGGEDTTTASFYRHYAGAFFDWSEIKENGASPLTVSSEEDTWKLRIECYDYYREHNPKDCVMGREDEQCEIILQTDSEESPVSPQWTDHDELKQKGEIKPEEDVREVPDPRTSRDHPEPWKEDKKTNLSLLDVEKLQQTQQMLSDPLDLTRVTKALLPVRMKAAIGRKQHSARADAFSDDGERTFASFWEDEQRALIKRLREPQIRLILPSRFIMGLSEHDPLFALADHIESKSSGITEVTVGAGTSILESVLMSLKRSTIVPIEEVRLPILIPQISLFELDALIADWEQWKIAEDTQARTLGRPSTAGEVDQIIAKLESYKTHQEKVRRLRGVLVKTLEKAFEPEKQVRTFLSSWYQQNLEIFGRLSVENEQRKEMHSLWREIQAIMLETDASQLQWCSNQRYSLPLYSMLDLPEKWWGDKDPGEERNADFLPEKALSLLPYEQPKDREYDFSTMKLSTGSITIPTIWPVSVAINLPHPPLIGSETIKASELYALPSLPTEEEIVAKVNIPDVSLPTPPVLAVIPSHDFREDIKALEEFRDRMQKRKDAYDVFQNSVMIPPDPDQKTVKEGKIIHPEYELKARIGRLFARWAAQHKVDYAGREARFASGDVSREEEDCPDGVICESSPPVERTSKIWQWFLPQMRIDVTTLADDILRDRSLPRENQNPFDASYELLKRIFLDVPQPISIEESLIPLPPKP